MTATIAELATATEGFSLISNRKLLTLYSAMIACRRIAEKSAKKGQMKPAGAESILAHEAAVVGTTLDLLRQDAVAPALWPDTAIKMINPAVSLAETVSEAVRIAMANKGAQQITVLFAGFKRTQQSAWSKALTQAAENNLPILFVSLDNPKASNVDGVSIPVQRRGYSLPQINVDGNDVVAVYRVASESIAHARKGHGPALIHCMRTGAGDPIETMEKYLTGKGLDPRSCQRLVAARD